MRGFQQVTWTWGTVLVGLTIERIALALTLIIVAQKVSPFAYGQYTSSYSLLSFLVVLPQFGLDAWLLTRGTHSKTETFRLWKSSLVLRSRMLLLWGIGCIVLTFALSKETFPPEIMLVSLLGLIFDSFTLLAFAALRNLNQHHWVSSFQGIASLTLLLLVTILPLNNDRIIFFSLGRTTISIIFAVALYAFPGRPVWHYPPLLHPRRLLGEARTFLWSELSSVVYVRADIILLSLFLGASAVAVYGPAISILQFSFLIPRSLFFFVVPILAQSLEKSSDLYIKYGIIQICAQISIGVILTAILYFGAYTIIDLVFGDVYNASANILKLLSPIPLLRSVNFALGAMLASASFQPYRTKIQIGSASFNVVGNLLIIPVWGTLGSAIIYTASETALLIGYIIVSGIWIFKELSKQK